MVDRIRTAHPVSPALLSGLDRSLAVADVLLGTGRLPDGPERDTLVAGVRECRDLVSQVTAQLRLPLQPREVSRFVRLDVGEAADTLGRLGREKSAEPPVLSADTLRCLDPWRLTMRALLNAAETLANGRQPTSLPAVTASRVQSIALRPSESLYVSAVTAVIGQHLASAVSWLETAKSGLSGAIRPSFGLEDTAVLVRLCLAAQAQLQGLRQAWSLPAGPSPWAYTVSARLLEAHSAGDAAFQAARASCLAGEPALRPVVPLLAALLTRLKSLQRESVVAE